MTVAGVVSGATVGVLAGLALGWLPDPSPSVVAGVAAMAAMLDAGWRWVPEPVDLGRQVPLAWGRLFSPPVSAGLYGARLGVGPTTILTSWTWWAAVGLAAANGPATGALVGAVFHFARVVTMLVATSRGAGPAEMDRLDRMDRPSRWAGVLVTAMVAVGAVGLS